MPITGELYKFSSDNVNTAPDQAGVYALFKHGDLTYIGSATGSIRSRLRRHYNGDEGSCTQAATQYKREVTTNPLSRETALLNEYKDDHNGNLPDCNDVMP